MKRGLLANAEGTLADGRHLQLGVGDYLPSPPQDQHCGATRAVAGGAGFQGRTQPAPVSVQMTLPQLDYRRASSQLRNKEWLAFAGGRLGPKPS